jgi:hypothetical protein
MTWYDVGLIYAHYGRIPQAQAALGQAFQTLMRRATAAGSTSGADETLLGFIQQAMLRLVDILEQQSRGAYASGSAAQNTLPFSSHFTVVTYNYNDEDGSARCRDEDAYNQVQQETERLLDSSFWAAGAA